MRTWAGVGLGFWVTCACTPAVSSLEVTPKAIHWSKAGAVTQLAVTSKTAHGDTVAGRKYRYTSSNLRVAMVTAEGVVTAQDNGTATITVRDEKVTAVVLVEVRAVPEVLEVVPAALAARMGEHPTPFKVKVMDGNGAVVTGAMWTARLEDPSLATVAGETLTGIQEGTTTLKVTAQGLEKEIPVRVHAPYGAGVRPGGPTTPECHAAFSNVTATMARSLAQHQLSSSDRALRVFEGLRAHFLDDCIYRMSQEDLACFRDLTSVQEIVACGEHMQEELDKKLAR